MHINVLHGLNSRCSKYQKHHCRQRWWLGSMWCFTSLMSFYSQAGRCRTAGARPVALHTYHVLSPALMSENPDFFSNFIFFLSFFSLDQVIFVDVCTSPLIWQIWPKCFVTLSFQIWSFSIWEAKPKTLLSVAFEIAVFSFPFMILYYATGLWSYDCSLGNVKDVIKPSDPRLGFKRNLVKAVRWKLTLL